MHVKGGGVDRLLQAGTTYRVGRDPQADLVLTDPRVSWQHAVISGRGGSWLLEDAGSTNGTFVDRQRVRQVAITGTCAVRLGHPDDGPLLNCYLAGSPASANDGRPRVQAATAVWQDEPRPRQALSRRVLPRRLHRPRRPRRPRAVPPAGAAGRSSLSRSPSAVMKPAVPAAAYRPRCRQRGRRLRPERVPLPRRAAADEPRRLRDRRPGQP